MAESADRLKQAIQSLVRVRAAESFDSDGHRVVWHQGAQGADLLSHATPDGKLVRQELTLLGSCFLWTPESFRTGAVRSGSGSAAGLASDEIRLDDAVDPSRIRTAHLALAGYDGPDKYIRHIKQKIDYFAAGFAEREQIVVTASVPTLDGVTAKAAAPKPARNLNLLWIALGGIGLGAIIAAVLLLRH